MPDLPTIVEGDATVTSMESDQGTLSTSNAYKDDMIYVKTGPSPSWVRWAAGAVAGAFAAMIVSSAAKGILLLDTNGFPVTRNDEKKGGPR